MTVAVLAPELILGHHKHFLVQYPEEPSPFSPLRSHHANT